MNRLAFAITLPGLLLTLALPLQAQILLDDFSTATTLTLAQPGGSSVEVSSNMNSIHANREILLTASSPSSTSASVASGVLTVDGTGSGQTELEYIGFSPLDLGSNTFFQINVTNVTGSPTLTLEVGSLESPSLLTGTISLSASSDPASYSIDISQLPGYLPAFSTQVNRIYFLLSDPDENPFSVTADSVQLVPEPQSVLLLGFGAILLTVIALRRTRQNPVQKDRGALA